MHDMPSPRSAAAVAHDTSTTPYCPCPNTIIIGHSYYGTLQLTRAANFVKMETQITHMFVQGPYLLYLGYYYT